MIPEPTGASSGGSGSNAQRNVRYAYLVGRLRNRQMTMEEATELFGLMEGMLRQAEAARSALVRAAAAPAAPMAETPRPKAAPAPSGGDDFFLLGILAMGAGAGLLAAMSRRLAEGPVAAPDTKPKSP